MASVVLTVSMPAPNTEQEPEATMSKGKKETAKRKNTEEDDNQVLCVYKLYLMGRV